MAKVKELDHVRVGVADEAAGWVGVEREAAGWVVVAGEAAGWQVRQVKQLAG